MDIQFNENKYLETLSRLVNSVGVSGNEKTLGISDAIFEELSNINKNTYLDEVGNVITIFGSGKNKIIIDAHVDEVGFIVTKKTKKGIFLDNVGLINPEIVNGSNIFCPTKNIDGRLIYDNSKFTFVSLNDNDIETGDIITFKRHFNYNSKNRIISATALDNRASCAALIELVRQAKIDNDVTLIVAFTTRQELDMSSLPSFVEKYRPDFGIVMDVAYAQPIDFDNNEVTIPVLGDGCALQHFGYRFVVPRKVLMYFSKLATDNGIMIQNEIPPANAGKTSINHILVKNILSGVINIPARAQHTEISEMSLDDALASMKLIIKVINSFREL